ncbi:MAG TPA: chemotaxis response regulator protein-glutamate methylesterase [Burkholderiales bacterium]|nr:chemotaxis response regulator protein-glutamate methylesterase [Burkholderiales bacterium]
MERIEVLVVDDSALIRSLLAAIINQQHDMVCVGAAADPYAAREMIRNLDPDVITLDIEMPKMDGIAFLEHLMRLRPMPVLMVSTLTEKGSEAALRALECGAVDFVGKPKLDVASGMLGHAQEIVDKIRVAAAAKVFARTPLSSVPQKTVFKSTSNSYRSTEKLIAIGASTGGTEAIRAVLEAMPPDVPGIVITQHMPPGFTRAFAKRLDGLCRINVKEAEDGERVLPGHAYIAPGALHMLVAKSGANYKIALSDAPPVNRHRPSVDPLFRSVAAQAGPNAIGAMLTGMGKDGAQAMLEMRRAGAWTIAQDEASCIVFGMPKEAIALGAVDEVLPLGRIAARLVEQAARMGGGLIRV